MYKHTNRYVRQRTKKITRGVLSMTNLIGPQNRQRLVHVDRPRSDALARPRRGRGDARPAPVLPAPAVVPPGPAAAAIVPAAAARGRPARPPRSSISSHLAYGPGTPESRREAAGYFIFLFFTSDRRRGKRLLILEE